MQMDNQQTDALVVPSEQLPPTTATTAKPRRARRKPMQPWKKRPAVSADAPRLQDRSKLLQMKRWTLQVFERKPERYLEKKTGRSRAWWGHVARGNFKSVRPTLIDWYIIRAIAGVVSDESELDSALMSKLVRVMECIGALVAAVADLMLAVRTRASKTK